MDMKKIRDHEKELGKNPPPDLFEMVRRIVREGSSGTGEKVEELGRKEIEGREAVGFRTRAKMMDMVLWADPKTARPIRIEVGIAPMVDARVVMSNFCYDVDLAPSLFSLEVPKGYTLQTVTMTPPVEADLLRTLRTVAEHNKGVFPAEFGMNKEVMQAVTAAVIPEIDKIMAKYGGMKELEAKYGKELPPTIMAELVKAGAPLMQKAMQGIVFYGMLKPENDVHYAGKDVNLGTPDQPIFWYKPTGSEKYRVIYADLSVKEVAAEDLPEAPKP
jgi:hypothetical protein